MELNAALNQVRNLLALAEHENTPPHEAALARQRADAVMLKFAIDEAIARATKPVSERDKPDVLFVDIMGGGVTYSSWLTEMIAKHCRCMIRTYVYNRDLRKSQHKVYGFKSDLRYFEVMYTEIMLHMSAVLIPKWDKALSDEDNAYALHRMGLNWLQMAEMLGWHKSGVLERDGKFQERWILRSKETGEVTEERSNWQLGSSFKRMFERACKARGESPRDSRIAANGTETYRRSAAEGYVLRINRRMRETEVSRQAAGSGAELVLAGSADDLMAFFKEQNPDMFSHEPVASDGECSACKAAKNGKCRKHYIKALKDRPTDERAYQRGVEHANSAPLGRTVGGQKKAVDA